MKAQVAVWIHVFFTSEVFGSKWSASRSFRFTPGKRFGKPQSRSERYGEVKIVRIAIVILIYHRHKPIDSINLLGS
jgi:hypothetical protein